MFVHSIYSDLLQSLTYFLNNQVLTDSYLKIKNFQFNIGNSSFQLSYETQLELPAAIVSLQSMNQYISRPYTFHRNIFRNRNCIPVIYDQTKGIEISLQEELFVIAASVNINCESQLSAMEIQNRIINFLPLNKYLQAYYYTSYLEIDTNLLSKYLIDINKDKVENIFLKHNKYTDKLDYTFSVEYEPLIRLNSCDIGIDSSNNSSFQVSCSFEFLTHIPIYLIAPHLNWDNLVNKEFFQYNDIPVPVNLNTNILINLNDHKEICEIILPLSDIILAELEDTNVDIEGVEESSISSELEDEFFTDESSIDDIGNNPFFDCSFINGQIRGKFKSIIYTYLASTFFNNVKYDAVLTLNYNLITDTYNYPRCFVDGERLTGNLLNITILGNNKLSAIFSGIFNGKPFRDVLEFKYVLQDSIKEPLDLITTASPPYTIKDYKILPQKNNIFNSIPSINRPAFKINLAKTYITKVVLANNILEILNPPVTINEINYEFDLSNYNIQGKLDPDNGDLTLYNNTNISYIYFNLTFDYIQGIPSSIERISTNFNMNGEIISNLSPYKLLDGIINDYQVLLISSVNFDEDLNNISFPIHNDIIGVINNYKFITQDKVILDWNNLILNTELSNNLVLVFDLLNPIIYWKYFYSIDVNYPLYFCFQTE